MKTVIRAATATFAALLLTIGGVAHAASGGPIDPKTGNTVMTVPYITALDRSFAAPSGTIAALQPAGNSPELDSDVSVYSSGPAPDGTIAALHPPAGVESGSLDADVLEAAMLQ
jgi:hypothetical protein